MRKLATRVLDVLSSIGLSCVLILLLGLLTWLGTLEQVHSGLHEVQKKYFESFFLVHQAGPLRIPLPGAYLVLSLLFVNIVLGGMVRIRKGAATAGIIVAHVGIAVLLVAGFVKMHYSEDGHLTLYEGQQADYFTSYYRWELAIAHQLEDGRVEERVVPQEQFTDAAPGHPVTLTSVGMPFDLRVDMFLPNCRPLPKGPMFEVDVPVVDGAWLRAEPPVKEAEMNAAGAYVTVLPAGGGPGQTGIVWAHDSAPWTVTEGGQTWTVDLRHERYSMPFTIALEKFTKKDHPRTGMPSWFSSEVKVVEGSAQRDVTISMNEPLRAGGLVLYQASWGPSNARPGDPLFSTLAVVRNPADQIPLIGCLIVAAGLLMHFSRKLLRWMRRESRGARVASQPAVSTPAAPTIARGARRTAGVVGLLALLAWPASGQGAAEEASTAARPFSWSEETLALAESLPIQDGGRIKPLSTYAGFTLLRMNGKRSVKTPGGERLTPIAWLLDVLVYPEMARKYEMFLIQDSAVAEAIGVSVADKKKRDRYTFEELQDGISRLFQLAHEYEGIEEKERSSVQQQIVLLARNVYSYIQLERHLDFTRYVLPLGDSPRLAAVFGGQHDHVLFTDVIAKAPELHRLQVSLSAEGGDQAQAELGDLMRLFQTAGQVVGESEALAFLPPAGSPEDEPAWNTPADVLAAALEGRPVPDEQRAALRGFDALSQNRTDPGEVAAALGAIRTPVVALATARGEYKKIGLELSYYRLGLIQRSLYLFVAAFLCVAILWLRPRGRVLHGVTFALVMGASLCLSAAIVQRCLIRGRPPVSTLYETVLFVTATGTLTALFVEIVNKKRLALSAAAALGTIGLFVANGYEMLDKQDTMPSLVAVLDTNFWLSTHVTSITLGYSAGMLAALLASIYLIVRAVAPERPGKDFFKSLARMVYGVLCFGLIFSLVGTILGGIWANESWGRFWGWDPKENGALLICLTQTAILHGRMGGYLRDLGICVAAAFGGTVVAFSWWGVNLLGVGLHSYGFTSGIHTALWTYYGIQWGIAALGGWIWLRERRSPARAPLPVRAATDSAS